MICESNRLAVLSSGSVLSKYNKDCFAVLSSPCSNRAIVSPIERFETVVFALVTSASVCDVFSPLQPANSVKNTKINSELGLLLPLAAFTGIWMFHSAVIAVLIIAQIQF